MTNIMLFNSIHIFLCISIKIYIFSYMYFCEVKPNKIDWLIDWIKKHCSLFFSFFSFLFFLFFSFLFVSLSEAPLAPGPLDIVHPCHPVAKPLIISHQIGTWLRENQMLEQSSRSTTQASRDPLRVDKAIETAVEVRTQWRWFIAYLTISFKDLKNICAIKLADVFLFIILMLNFWSSVHDHWLFTGWIYKKPSNILSLILSFKEQLNFHSRPSFIIHVIDC